MKLCRLSLVAALTLGASSSLLANDTIYDAFVNGSFEGRLAMHYFDRTENTGIGSQTVNENLFTNGILLGYKTGQYKGFTFGVTGQFSSSPDADADAKIMFGGDQYGSGAQLSEAYLEYTINTLTLKVGRMFLDTPLVATSGSRMIKDAFEGGVVVFTAVPNTVLAAGYVDKYQNRTDGNGDIGKFETVGDGAYTFFVKNNSINGLNLTGAWAQVRDFEPNSIDLNVFYAEADYVLKTSNDNLSYNFAAQYYGNSYSDDVDGADYIGGYGIKAAVSAYGINAKIAYSKVDDEFANNARGIVPGLGNGADLMYTGSLINSDSYGNNTEAYLIDVNYDIRKGTNFGIQYVETDDEITKASFMGVYLSHDCVFVDGLNVSLEYEDQGKDLDGNELRVKFAYNF